MILPHKNYCILSWGKESESILQKRAIRAIVSAGYRAQSEPLFKIYNLLKVTDIYQQRLLIFYYKILNCAISANFNNFIPTFSEGINTYSIRNPQRQIPKHPHDYIKQTCRYQRTIIINEIVSIGGKYLNTVIFNTIQNAANIPLASFKRTIKSYFLGEYPYL